MVKNKITLTGIKADVGSIGGHLKPSQKLIDTVDEYVHKHQDNLIKDYRISYTGDDILILLTHTGGVDNERIHKLAWDAFVQATEVAKKQGLYGAGQDLLKNSFAGNVKGLGPGIAEMEFEERPNESFLVFAADKTDPGAYNLLLYLAYTDPMYNSGLILSQEISRGYEFKIMDIAHTKANKTIRLKAPNQLYEIAALLREPMKYVIHSIFANYNQEQSVAVSTTRLKSIAGRYTGKDDPVCIVRVQGVFPATGEVVAPFELNPLVSGFARGSHCGPLMPVKQNTTISYFDGPPIVSGMGYSIRQGKLTEGVDLFDHPFWEQIRKRAVDKTKMIREQGFYGAAMLPFSELEYNQGVVNILKNLENRFKIEN
ncbi:MAG: fructose 1,6-bisphosphatase [Candidatus Moranbacteria bacterium]|nr:fructose 1,6-bisphosphatase [Candidatus Moranbacteria bacterium]